MRQAGRYLPEYQAVRKHHSFLEICKTPEIAAEVSLQPFNIIGVDAIVVFSDILIVAEAMGLPLAVPDDGPVLSNPIRDIAAVRKLHDFDPNVETKFVGDAIREICRKAGSDVPVIGFAAAPWTLACYMIEGRTRGDISLAKQMLDSEPAVVHELLDRIAQATISYLRSHIEAGASVVQLFDTWAGELTAEQYRTFELPATQKVLRGLGYSDVPKILYAKGSSHLVNELGEAGADVVSIDWRTDLAVTRAKLGDSVALQGNVDPSLLLTTEDAVRNAAREAVLKTGGIGHILNLGHGILPNTPVANARAFVEAGQAVRIPARVPAAHL
jgi:uroporphyrinogen decarboxylase